MKQATFGELLRTHRAKHGLSQRALAHKLGEFGIKIDPTAITRMETDQREPKLGEAMALADYLGFNLQDVEAFGDRMVWEGLVDRSARQFFSVREDLKEFIDTVWLAYNGFGTEIYDTNANPQRMPPGHAEAHVKEVISSLVGQEEYWDVKPTSPVLAPGPDFPQWLLGEITKGLWPESDEAQVTSTEHFDDSPEA